MPFKAKVRVTLRKSILDVQGKAVHHALENLGYESIESVRIGKYMELDVAESSAEKARAAVEDACKKLLSNPVMEDYHIDLEEI
ncbi:MAG: phosphoribosylformylglycinamidine synthase [[Candidatus Thermochlorobacteriaceae] bacterium GBChlB]|jgi:phosphoribosylformylglycinamidine synthase|nr:MAG: phosphoribosylformylglycinamidine synthase [[Candidatus Thermochlorobacteriaceae] bacterium GBChlB]